MMAGAMVYTSDHFARIRPIVGTDLAERRVAVIGWPGGETLVRYLAASGVRGWQWLDITADQETRLRAELAARHGSALGLMATSYISPAWLHQLGRSHPDLVIIVGGGSEARLVAASAVKAGVPMLQVLPPTPTRPCRMITFFPGDDPALLLAGLEVVSAEMPAAVCDNWAWQTAAPLCAGLARAILLRETTFRRPDLAVLWAQGNRVATVGQLANPFQTVWSSQIEAGVGNSSPFETPPARRGKLLIAGLGSLGSMAAVHLVDHVASFVIADPDQVDSYNPVRQAYPTAAVGQSKAVALGEQLRRLGAAEVVPFNEALLDERQVAALIERQQITAALVVTGTAADFAIARVLRQSDMSHVVGRCYPRARYWEAILVDGGRGPSLADLRGHLQLGPTPPPTPEQRAAYSDAGTLEAEPATLIESGWAAIWLARLTAQFLTPPGLRERWFLELLASETTCLVGGGGVEMTDDGPAWGLDQPGQIRAWGRSNIRGRTSPQSPVTGIAPEIGL